MSSTMPIFGEKPHTSITVKINQLLKPNRNSDLEDESIELYLDDLLQLIKLLPGTGAVEAARAVRKNIKYGNTPEEQIQALNLLELLVLNAGPKIGTTLASDDKLLDVLKSAMTGDKTGAGVPYDRKVQQKVWNLAIDWKLELRDLDGYKYMANLWKFIPRKPKKQQSTAKDFGDSESPRSTSPVPRMGSPRGTKFGDSESSLVGRKSPPPRPMLMSPYATSKPEKEKRKLKKKKGKKGVVYADETYKIPQINYKVEAPKIRTTISDCHTHTTALNNALLALSGSDPLDDPKASQEFEKCRKIRRSVLRYLQYVGAGEEANKLRAVQEMDEEFLGSLIFANEQLVNSFQKFDKACGYTAENPAPNYDEDDSDESYYSSESEEEDLIDQSLAKLDVEGSSSRLQQEIHRAAPPPPRKAEAPSKPQGFVVKTPTGASVESDDPFGDSNAVGKGASLYH